MATVLNLDDLRALVRKSHLEAFIEVREGGDLHLWNPYMTEGNVLYAQFHYPMHGVGEVEFSCACDPLINGRKVKVELPIPAEADSVGHDLGFLAWTLQSSVIPSLYATKTIVQAKYAFLHATPMDVFKQLVMFYYVQWFERNNLRYCLGMGANGYARPHVAHVDYYSRKIGNYDSDAGMQSKLCFAFLSDLDMDSGLAMYITGQAMPDKAWLNKVTEPYMPLVEDYDKTVLNMSFGKESLFAYEFMGRAPQLFTFSHNSEPTDYQKRADALDPSAKHMVCDYLPQILDPIGSQLLPGAPIHTLFIPNMMAQAAALAGSDRTHILFGDEYERAKSLTMVKFNRDSNREEPVFTYDFNQTDRFAIAWNACRHSSWPFIGSIMYNMTGLQAQMVFDQMDSTILQTSCHPSLVTGKNCGKCAKCRRVGLRKKVVGTMANVDYDISWEAAKDTAGWTMLEYYGHGMNYGGDHALTEQHDGMWMVAECMETRDVSMLMGPGWQTIPRLDSFWESMGTLLHSQVEMLTPQEVERMAHMLKIAADEAKKNLHKQLLELAR